VWAFGVGAAAFGLGFLFYEQDERSRKAKAASVSNLLLKLFVVNQLFFMKKDTILILFAFIVT
jgi:hypothetical protein